MQSPSLSQKKTPDGLTSFLSKSHQEKHACTTEPDGTAGILVSGSLGRMIIVSRHPSSSDKQPKHDEQRHKQEEAGQKLLVRVLRGSWSRWRWSSVIDIECRGKDPERKSANTERHLEASISEAEALKSATVLRFRPLSLWSWRSSLSGVLLTCAASAVQRDHFVSADACFTHGTHLSVRPGFQPLMQTRPAEEMSAQTDDGVFGRVQTDVALKRAVLSSAAAAVLSRRLSIHC